MKDYECVSIGREASSGMPAFVFDAELHEGEDFDGKFEFGFALGEAGGTIKFYLRSPQGMLAAVPRPQADEIVNALYEHSEYKAFVNYENTTINRFHAIEVPILGRFAGEEYDWVDHVQLPQEHREQVAEMKEILDNR